jgi:hypothetical protein
MRRAGDRQRRNQDGDGCEGYSQASHINSES